MDEAPDQPWTSDAIFRCSINSDTFTVTDTFGYLLANLNAAAPRGIRYCDG
jgi:hypothetical protein